MELSIEGRPVSRSPLDTSSIPDNSHLQAARPSPWNTLKLVWDKEAACTILFSAVIYAGYLSITTTLPFEQGKHYGFNALQIGLCYLSYGGGSLTSRWTAGTLMNWNF
jgi:predicted MFS family arabinose efflux permease